MGKYKLSKVVSTVILLITIVSFMVILVMYFRGNYTSSLLLEDTFFVFLTVVSVGLLSRVEKHYLLDLKEVVRTLIYLFLFALLMVGNVYDVIAKTLWFDKLLHFMSGIFLTYIGIEFAKKWIHKRNRKVYGYIGFMYSATVTLLWEIIEFIGDIIMFIVFPEYLFRLQTFHLTEPILFLPQPHGLADTMIDVTLGVLGAFLVMLHYSYHKNIGDVNG